MKKSTILSVAALLLAAALTACSPSINQDLSHQFSFDGKGMVMHAPGKPDARIERDGSLAIGNRKMAVTPSQRALLRQYYQQGDATMKAARQVAEVGGKLGKHVADNLIHSVFSGDPTTAEKQIETQSNDIETAANQLCNKLDAMNATEQEIATRIAALAPYTLDHHEIRCDTSHTTMHGPDGTITTSTGVRIRSKDGSGLATTYRSDEKSKDAHPADAATSPARTTHRGNQP